jgi:hypothetical protein
MKRPLYFVHGLPGNRNVFRQDADGDLAVSSAAQRFQWHPSAKDSQRQLWNGGALELGFGFPAGKRGGRELLDGYLPQLRTWWQDGPLYYEQTTILGKLDGDLDSNALDDPTVLLMRVRVVNTSVAETAPAALLLSSRAADAERLQLDGERVVALANNHKRLRSPSHRAATPLSARSTMASFPTKR